MDFSEFEKFPSNIENSKPVEREKLSPKPDCNNTPQCAGDGCALIQLHLRTRSIAESGNEMRIEKKKLLLPKQHSKVDAMGNRIVKIVKPRDGSGVKSQLNWTYTYYERDAQGNVLAVYERTFEDTHAGNTYKDKLNLAELDIYGSKRLGELYSDTTIERTFTDAVFTDADGNVFHATYNAGSSTARGPKHKRTLGKKAYEIVNHLGNILATVSDKKLPADVYSYTTWSSGTKYAYNSAMNSYYQSTSGTYQRTASSSDNKADYYTADVRSYSDYYAFGAKMDGRNGGEDHRYKFNGHEDEGEDVNAQQGSEYDLGERFYDARLGKMLSVDPLTGNYPGQSPYAYCGNSPTSSIDLNGAGDGPASAELGRRNSIMSHRIGGATSSGNGINMLSGTGNSTETNRHPGYYVYGHNTPVGRFTADYTPIDFLQIGGNRTYTIQNDIGAIDHPISDWEYRPDEPSSYSSLLWTYRSDQGSYGFTFNQSRGISLTRKKGGVFVEGGQWNGEPHFGHGAGTIGGAYKFE